MRLEEGNSKQTVTIPSDLFVALKFFENKVKKFDTPMDEEERKRNKDIIGIGLTDGECISDYTILLKIWERNHDMVKLGYQHPDTIISTLGYCPMQFIAHLEWRYRLIIQRIWIDEGNIPHITDINGASSAVDLTGTEMQCLYQLIPTDNHIYIVQRELYEKLLAETCRYINTPYFGSLGFVGRNRSRVGKPLSAHYNYGNHGKPNRGWIRSLFGCMPCGGHGKSKPKNGLPPLRQ